MKDRINSAVLWLVAGNALCACAVFVLAYAAGAHSGGNLRLRELNSSALYLLLCAAAALVAGVLLVFFRLSNAVCAPMKNLTAFAEQLSSGNFEARLQEVGGGTFGYINLHLNEAAARAAKAGHAKQEGVQAKANPLPSTMDAAALAQQPAEELAAIVRRVRDAAESVTSNASELLTASKLLAEVARQQEHDVLNTPSAPQSTIVSPAERKPRQSASSIAATVAAALQPEVVAPPVSIPGAQITGAVNLPLASTSRVAAGIRAISETPAQLTPLQARLDQVEKHGAAGAEKKS